MADEKVLEWSSLGADGSTVKSEYVYEIPPFIVSVEGSNSFEFSPIMKAEEADPYSTGVVVGYKLDNDNIKTWGKVASAGTDTEKRACGILIAASALETIGLKSASPWNKKPISPWVILVRNAVVNIGGLRKKGVPELVGTVNPYEVNSDFKTDSEKRIAELENYCNIKVKRANIMLTGILEKAGEIS